MRRRGMFAEPRAEATVNHLRAATSTEFAKHDLPRPRSEVPPGATSRDYRAITR